MKEDLHEQKGGQRPRPGGTRGQGLAGFSTVRVVQSRSQRAWPVGRAGRTAERWRYFGWLSRGGRLDAAYVSLED